MLLATSSRTWVLPSLLWVSSPRPSAGVLMAAGGSLHSHFFAPGLGVLWCPCHREDPSLLRGAEHPWAFRGGTRCGVPEQSPEFSVPCVDVPLCMCPTHSVTGPGAPVTSFCSLHQSLLLSVPWEANCRSGGSWGQSTSLVPRSHCIMVLSQAPGSRVGLGVRGTLRKAHWPPPGPKLHRDPGTACQGPLGAQPSHTSAQPPSLGGPVR